MRLPYNNSYSTTQVFNDACCRANYAQYGMQGHNGIDYGLPCGTEIVSPINGTVTYFSEPGGYGEAVFIRGEGVEVVLAHLSRVDKRSGSVSAGEHIGLSGTTGNSNGCHLHFGVRPYPEYNRANGFLGYVDPQEYLNGGGTNMPTIVDQSMRDYLYDKLLKRPARPEDGNNWIGTDIVTAIHGIAESEEAQAVDRLYEIGKKSTVNRDDVNALYQFMTGRDATEQEKIDWEGKSFRDAVMGIGASGPADEFRKQHGGTYEQVTEQLFRKK